MYKKIGDYGIIGNLRSVALVGEGRGHRLALPAAHDSPSVFAAIPDADDGGTFSVTANGTLCSPICEDSNVFVADYAGEEAARPLREDPGAFAMEYSRYDWRVEPREERPWEERSGP